MQKLLCEEDTPSVGHIQSSSTWRRLLILVTTGRGNGHAITILSWPIPR